MIDRRKYRIFISSTYTDLIKERQALMLSLLEQGHIPVGMELFPTEDTKLWALIQQQIKECDYYVVLVGGRYGTLSPMGLSYTHQEFVCASSCRKPILALVYDKPDLLPAERRDSSRAAQLQLKGFCDQLERSTTVRRWNNRHELRQIGLTILPQFIKENPAVGLVLAGNESDQQELVQLRKRVQELEQKLDAHSPASKASIRFQADEVFPVKFQADIYAHGSCSRRDMMTRLSWGKLLSMLAPIMLRPVSEEVLRQHIQNSLKPIALAEARKYNPEAHAASNISLSSESFGQIKMGFRAAGVIALEEGIGKPGLHWKITPHGDKLAARLLV